MNTVNTYNYESYLLDFAEGRLSRNEINDLFDFLSAHPEFKEDFEAALEIPVLHDYPVNSFSRKNALLKNESLDRIQDLVIAAVEHVALPSELNELKQLEVNNPMIKRELEIFAKLRFFEDPNVCFSKKGGLYKSPLVAFSTWMYRVSAVAAAAVVFIFTIHFLNTAENGNYKAQADRLLKNLQNRTDFKQQVNRDLPRLVEQNPTQKLPGNAKDALVKGITPKKATPIINFHSPSRDLAINGDTVDGQNVWMVMNPVNANQLEIPSTGSLASFSSNPPASQVNSAKNDFKSLLLEESTIINSSYNLAGDVSARVKSFAGEFNKYNEVELNVFGVHATIHKPSWMNWSRHLVKS